MIVFVLYQLNSYAKNTKIEVLDLGFYVWELRYSLVYILAAYAPYDN